MSQQQLSIDAGLVTLCLAPRGNQFATLEVTRRAWVRISSSIT